jgi:hypothetical protein
MDNIPWIGMKIYLAIRFVPDFLFRERERERDEAKAGFEMENFSPFRCRMEIF